MFGSRHRRLLRLDLALAAAIALPLAGAVPCQSAAQVVLGLPDEPADAKVKASDRVKAGMAGIRKLVIDAHTLITHRRLSPDSARRFAAGVDRHISEVKGDPTAAALSPILDDIAGGAAHIAAPDSGDGKLDGLDKIETALARYPQLFDDPDWKPLR